jgi:hypothetical protein
LAPTANVDDGHVAPGGSRAPTEGMTAVSVTETALSATLPVLVTTKW